MVGYWKLLLLAALLVLNIEQGLGWWKCARGQGVCGPKYQFCHIKSYSGCPKYFKCCKPRGFSKH